MKEGCNLPAFLFFLFLVIPVYLLASGVRYYSVSHKINGIKPHNKMTLETSVPTSHKTGFIFTSQFNNMKIPQKKNLPVLQKLSPKMIIKNQPTSTMFGDWVHLFGSLLGRTISTKNPPQ